MTIAASILFDTAYTEPALVTAFELIDKYPTLHRVYFILVHDDTDDDREAALILQHFCLRFNQDRPDFFQAITVKNAVGTFVSRHFSAAIIYKGIVASLLAHEPFILNIDAGILPGDRFDGFLRDIDARLCQQPGEWVVAAHNQSPEGRIPPALRTLEHHPRYPAGGMLLYHTANYNKSNWRMRFMELFTQAREVLAYAEQELICLIARGPELAELPGGEARVTPFLKPDTFKNGEALLTEADARNSLFFKFIGSMKPWKYWVLDPNKALWTSRRAKLQEHFPLRTISLIHKQRELVTNEGFKNEFLEAFDSWTELPR